MKNNWQRADTCTQKVEGKWRRERSKLRWGIVFKVTQKDWEKNEKKIDGIGQLTENVVSKTFEEEKTQWKRNSWFYFLEYEWITIFNP